MEEEQFKRTADFAALYSLKEDLGTLAKDLSDLKTMVAVHIKGDEARDANISKISTAIEGNGKPGILSDIVTLQGYVKFIAGAGAAVGIIWSVLTFIIPLFTH